MATTPDAIAARLAYRRAHAAELRTARAYEAGTVTAGALKRAVGRTCDALARAVDAGCDPEALADDGRRLEHTERGTR